VASQLAIALFVWSLQAGLPLALSPTETAPPAASVSAGDVGFAVGGFVAGFLAHESGHLIANWAFGNYPRPKWIWVAGFIPFVDLDPELSCNPSGAPDRCVDRNGEPFTAGRRGKFVIVSSGFYVQHLTNEVLLRMRPQLRYQSAPFLKGLLAFNTLVSVMYAVGAVTGLEPSAGGDIANQARMSGLPRAALAGAVLVPAMIDLYRYARPEAAWAPWAAVATKAGYVGLAFAF
jgi:hypothetical protein